ncbi:MAG: ABC transporter ATP-binding protein [Hydrogenophilales bacterium]|nr:ABC transporter ATP-binding protein [Hydrogenophilales bacterium]
MTAAVSIRGLEKRYASVHALQGIDLEIAEGEFFALLGPNGAGKTTLISILAGLTRASAGSAEIMGYDVLHKSRHARRNLGVVPQELIFDPFFSVREMLRFQSGYFGLRDNDAWIDEILDNLALTDKANTNTRLLSGGMKRRVLVAQALVHKPPVIVLDEPTAGVDVELRQTLWAFIRRLNRQGHTILLTTHYLEEAEALCNRVAMLKAGRVVALDHTANLLHSGDERRLEITLAPADQLPAILLPRLVKQEGSLHVLRLLDYADLEGILTTLRTSGVAVVGMNLRQIDLEEVFIRIMGQESDA